MISRHNFFPSALRSLLLVLSLSLLSSCASDSPTKSSDLSPPSVPAPRLRLQVADAGNMSVLYTIEPGGTFTFSGGMDAHFEKASWSIVLTDDEIVQLYKILDDNHLLDSDPSSTNNPPERIYHFRAASADGSNSFTVHGESPQVRPLFDLLDSIARRRLKPALDALPKAGQQH